MASASGSGGVLAREPGRLRGGWPPVALAAGQPPGRGGRARPGHAGPIRQRGPVSSRASAFRGARVVQQPAASPPRPAPRAPRAARRAPPPRPGCRGPPGACRSGNETATRFRHSTAMSDGRTPVARRSGPGDHGRPSGASPAAPASSAAGLPGPPTAPRPGSCPAGRTPPCPACDRSGADTSRGTSGASYRSSSWMAAAASSTRAELRKLVDSCSTGAGPEGRRGPERPGPRHHREVGGEPPQVAGAPRRAQP